MKVAIYARVSTDEQTVENQVRDLVEYAEKSKWDYEVLTEVESSRKTRPIKYELMNRLRCKEFDALLVWKLDRWARSVREVVNDIAELEDKGVSFISLRDNIDLSTSTGKLQFHIISAFAEFERSMISERTKAGLKGKENIGKRGRDKKPRRKSGYHLRWAKQRGSVKTNEKPQDAILQNP